MTTTSRPPALQRLMAIADRYARKLVTEVTPPDGVLLLERAGELAVVMLDGSGCDAATVRRLLTSHGATSAALMVEIQAATIGHAEHVFCILGETLEGATDDRRYRVRPCGRERRLTPLAAGGDGEVDELFRPLFPVHVIPRTADDVPGDPAAEAAVTAYG